MPLFKRSTSSTKDSTSATPSAAGAPSSPSTSLNAKGKPARRSVGGALRELFSRWHFFLHICWLFFHTRFHDYMLGYSWSKPAPPDRVIVRSNAKTATPSSERTAPRRRVLFIGDDYALGVGDWIRIGDVPGLVNHIKFPMKGLFQKWDHAVAARRGATTLDWDPDFGPVVPGCGGLNLFQSTFHPDLGRFYACDVVVIVLGVNDKCAPDLTVQRLKRIAAALASQGKMVVVVTPTTPAFIGVGHSDAPRCASRTTAVNAWLAELHPSDVIRKGADFSLVTDARHFRFTGRFWSSKGYTFAAQLLSENLMLACRTAENRDPVPCDE